MVRIDEEGHYVRRLMRWVELPEGAHGFLEPFVSTIAGVPDEVPDRVLEVAHGALDLRVGAVSLPG